MKIEIERCIICKAEKIALYLKTLHTDEEFFERKKELEQQYSRAKKFYLITSDKKYKKEMKKIMKYKFYNVSQTEFETCKKDLYMFKKQYCEEKYNDLWEYIEDLLGFNFSVLSSIIAAEQSQA